MSYFVKRIYILGLLFVLIVGMSIFWGQRHLQQQRQREIERSIAFKTEHIIDQISSDLNQAESALKVAESFITAAGKEDQIRLFFQDILEQNESYSAIYLGKAVGETIYAGKNGGEVELDDPRVRPWYQAAVQENKPVFTAPYIDNIGGHLVITLAQPVYKEKELIGVVGIDKSLSGMLELLEEQKASENGHSLLFNAGGEVLVCPCPDYEVEQHKNLFDVSDLQREFLQGQSGGTIRAGLHGKDGYFKFQALDGLDLYVGTFAALSDFTDQKALNRQVVVTVFLLSGAVFYLLVVLPKKHIIGPVRELNNDIMAISPEDFSYRLPLRPDHVFGDLRETINISLEKAEQYFQNVVLQQEELTAAFDQLVAHEEQLRAQYEEIKGHQAQLRYIAGHDSLTGIFNRRKFAEDLITSLERGASGAVFMLDIDDFKNINDIQGHVFGDKVLRHVAELLKENLSSQAKVYRFGGDEFLILLEGIVSRKESKVYIEEIFGYFKDSCRIDGRLTHLAVSIGVVQYPLDGESVDELLMKVDIAMHNAKKAGKNRFIFFESNMAATFSARVHIERLLMKTLQKKNFKMLYQPIVESSSGQIAYFEALIRIKNNSLSPAVFIPIAEESNLIIPIGRWVLREVIRQISRWEKKEKDTKRVSVNLSPKQFYDAGLLGFLAQELNCHKVDPSLLEMEITETVFIDNIDEAVEIIKGIRALGIKVSLDDFGTGYSSINYITRIPVDRIKLDRRITSKLVENHSVMEGLVIIAHGLKMEVVAEGVESSEEARFLKKAGCDYLQGYFFSEPVPPQDAFQIMHVSYGGIPSLED
ncbi:MAG: EAL domain-containing protein [Firmicutes bacterium]|nr:EAL domain-containing protein [Bacillota bacterium]